MPTTTTTTTTAFRAAYARVIGSARWRELRQRLIATRGPRCERCRKTWAPGYRPKLALHHKTYERLGYERDEDVELLCGCCHERADMERQGAAAVARYSARVNGWASKVFGVDWNADRDFESVAEAFDAWAERRGLDDLDDGEEMS